MSLRTAILGILSQRSLTGFELIREFDVARSVIWPAPQNEVYRVLGALAGEGLIEQAATGARGARTYAITPAGREAVEAWLAAPSDYTLRYDPILKAVFLRGADPTVRRARAEADLAFFNAQRAALEKADAAHAGEAETDVRGDGRRMAILLYAALAQWAREIVEDKTLR
ncbi:MAG TPA: PadR family transcriptional regulator [Caulobacterales bacterium]|nr:PadR family transcriptional regulator [Caulobacterales bacterium]